MTLQQIETLEPDQNGVILVDIEGQIRRFVKEKFINYLRSVFPKELEPKKPYGAHKRRPVVAILPDGTERHFASCAEAAQALKIDRTNIPHVLSGKYKHVYGIKFRDVETEK